MKYKVGGWVEIEANSKKEAIKYFCQEVWGYENEKKINMANMTAEEVIHEGFDVEEIPEVQETQETKDLREREERLMKLI